MAAIRGLRGGTSGPVEIDDNDTSNWTELYDWHTVKPPEKPPPLQHVEDRRWEVPVCLTLYPAEEPPVLEFFLTTISIRAPPKIMTELYDILDVPEDASKEAIKKAFRAQARKTHPDRGGNVEEFVKAKNAYLVLYNDESRKKYDDSGVYGDTVTPSKLIQAYSNLANMMAKIISAKLDDLGVFDVMGCLAESINDNRNSNLQAIAKLELQTKKLKRARDRFFKKAGNEEHVLKGVFIQQIEGNGKNIEAFKNTLELLDLMEEVIEDYGYTFDEVTDIARGVYFHGFIGDTTTI